MQWKFLRPNVAPMWSNVAPMWSQCGPMWPQCGTNVTPMLPLWDPNVATKRWEYPFRWASIEEISKIEQKHEKLESSMQWKFLRPNVDPMWSNVAPKLPNVAPVLPQCCPNVVQCCPNVAPMLPRCCLNVVERPHVSKGISGTSPRTGSPSEVFI